MTHDCYLVGSLRNPAVSKLANRLRQGGLAVFDDWMAAGPEADDKWMEYEKARGHTLAEALQGHAAQHVFKFDREHIESSRCVVLVMPAGKSGHLELGFACGLGKRTAILLDKEPERYDVMYAFADLVTSNVGELTDWLTNGTVEGLR